MLFAHSVSNSTVPAHRVSVSNWRNADYNNPNGITASCKILCFALVPLSSSVTKITPWVSGNGFVLLDILVLNGDFKLFSYTND